MESSPLPLENYSIHSKQQQQQKEEEPPRKSKIISNLQCFISSIATELQESLQDEEVIVTAPSRTLEDDGTDQEQHHHHDDSQEAEELKSQGSDSLSCGSQQQEQYYRNSFFGCTNPSNDEVVLPTPPPPKRRNTIFSIPRSILSEVCERPPSPSPPTATTQTDEDFATIKKRLASSKYVTSAGLRHVLASDKKSSSSSSVNSNSTGTSMDDTHSLSDNHQEQQQSRRKSSFVSITPAIHHIHKMMQTSSLKDEEVEITTKRTSLLFGGAGYENGTIDEASSCTYENHPYNNNHIPEAPLNKNSCLLTAHGALSIREHDSLHICDFQNME